MPLVYEVELANNVRHIAELLSKTLEELGEISWQMEKLNRNLEELNKNLRELTKIS